MHLNNRDSATNLINRDREIDSYGFSDKKTTKTEKDENKEFQTQRQKIQPNVASRKQKTKPNKINQKNRKENDDQAILPWPNLWNSTFLEDLEYLEARLVAGTIKSTKKL
ncbi:hypothetical protein M9H77_08463 [Catharanthus roseus]|uniref:Uncharacterized protein n=1 Tax=Catharanthus roseus TaxID=4058 RepID=A0ACC0BXU8_CATRO|nr:hypothetical protein M9H77_08463 [Catharanthus roseus]